MSRKVVMQEQLTSHKVEREIMSCPAEEKEAGRIVESRSSSWAPDWGLDYNFVILIFVRVISDGGKRGGIWQTKRNLRSSKLSMSLRKDS